MHPVNLLQGEFSRAEQRVLRAIFKAIAEGGGRCVATLEILAREILEYWQVNDAQRDRTRSRNRSARRDRAPLLLRSLASQHFEPWKALAAGAAVGSLHVPDGLVGARMAGI